MVGKLEQDYICQHLENAACAALIPYSPCGASPTPPPCINSRSHETDSNHGGGLSNWQWWQEAAALLQQRRRLTRLSELSADITKAGMDITKLLFSVLVCNVGTKMIVFILCPGSSKYVT